MKRTLLLNNDLSPLNFITCERAFLLILKGRAEIVTNMDGDLSVWCGEFLSTVDKKFDVVATIKLNDYVKRKIRPPRFRKRVLFNRDNWKCQYCEIALTDENATMDHIVPSSRGGKTSWLNCVAACRSCNRKKGNNSLADSNMKLLKKPTIPNSFHFWLKNKQWHNDWSLFVQDAN